MPGIDPRGPRFAAGITATLLAVTILLSLTGSSVTRALSGQGAAGVAQRAAEPGFLVLLVVTALFAWAVLSPRTAPWGVVYRTLVQPRLGPPADLEDPRPPRFAQAVGLVIAGAGALLHLAGMPFAVPVAASFAFVAAFLNVAFDVCLGCRVWLMLQRVGVTGRPTTVPPDVPAV
ncbi:DUF4395 domain-containing protein [Microbacterium sp.]|uniref:DUF4395 domain-containing protein n=1 Tax=Microbacterium sp. TaxID=51671 RepID=UPI003A8AC115